MYATTKENDADSPFKTGDRTMKNRLISATLYVVILLAFYFLKLFVHDFLFDVLIYAFALIGTFEILRATHDKTTKPQRVLVWIFSIICIPMVAVSEYFFRYGLHVMSVCFFFLVFALFSLLVVRHEETTAENIGVSLFSAVYPTVMLTLLVLANHIGAESETAKALALDSRLAILLIFVISPCSDAVAFVFGMLLKKYLPRKMAPTISPNKTVIGAVGGLVGGMLGALAVYFVYNSLFGSFANMQIWLPIYLAAGLLAAAATEFGDLVESCIKRKAGIKDMGKIMPGHGGVLDRIDGTLFATAAVYLVFVVIHLAL